MKKPLLRVGSGRTLAVFRAFLAAALALSAGGAIFATWRSLHTAQTLGARAMERTAFALAVSVENALSAGKSGPDLRAILADRVVAYALIADTGGTIRFHVNPELEGTQLPESDSEHRASEQPAGHTVALGVGTPAYEYDYPLRNGGDAGGVLRIVLHVGDVDRLGAHSRQLWVMIAGLLLLLGIAGVGLERMLHRLLRVSEERDRRERLSLIGQMTATLAHEIRNALWGVKGYAQWLDEKLSAETPGKGDVAAILQGTGRIEALVDDLLLYARQEAYRIEAVPLGPLVGEAASEATSGWPGAVRVEVEPSLPVRADREKLHRVLVNGIRNAVQAMGDRGTLTVRAGSSGSSAWLRIEDTGGGVAPEVAERLFTPFFTTKAEGTGLGLAYSKKVAEGMGGTVELRNGELGAVFTLRLPRAC